MSTVRQKLREAGVVLLAILAAVAALRQSAKYPGELSPLDRGILTLISPAQSALSTVARAIGGAAGRYVDLVHVRGENEKLRSENAELRAELMESRRAAAESTRLRRVLALRDAIPAASLAAQVISIDASPYFRVARIEIDRGDDLLRRGMPVITPDGVVGKINRVAGRTSDILLAVDPASKIDVILPRTSGRGILVGKSSENGYRCSIQYLARGEEAREGDLVVTSGLGDFPRDIPLGTVSKVTRGAASLFQDVEVTPAVDFARLSEVLVVVAPPPAPDPDASSKRIPGPSRGLSVYR
jgi:rod shape-determining protein MreC